MRTLTSLVLVLLALVLIGCGVSQEKYDKLLADRNDRLNLLNACQKEKERRADRDELFTSLTSCKDERDAYKAETLELLKVVRQIPAKLSDNPHIGISGHDFSIIPQGESHQLLEQAVIMVRTTGDQMLLLNFGESGRLEECNRPGHFKFQVLFLNKACVEKQGDFDSLNYDCVLKRQAMGWSEIKAFLAKGMPMKEFREMAKALETYLQKEKLL